MRVTVITWIVLAAGIVGLMVVARLLRGRSESARLDVGSVSDQWIAEHRAGQSNGSTHS